MRTLLAIMLLTATPYLLAEDAGELYATQCASCHGKNALGNAAAFSPRLAGQNSRYLRDQLLAYHQGKRGTHPDDFQGQAMRALTLGLSADQIEALSTHLASLDGSVERLPAADQDHTGAELYRDNCATCHGQQATGAESIFVPNLAILSNWYLDAQLQAYEKGWRGGESGSTRAKNMRSIGAQLQRREEQAAVIAFIANDSEQ